MHDTPILRADGTPSPISEIHPGDDLLAFTSSEEIVHTTVRQVINNLAVRVTTVLHTCFGYGVLVKNKSANEYPFLEELCDTAVDQISSGETLVPSRLRLAIRPPLVIT